MMAAQLDAATISDRRADADRFLLMLDETREEFAFQVFYDDARNKFALQLLGTLEQHWEELDKLNSRGCGVFVCINELRPGKKRRADNVIRVRSTFADFDTPYSAPDVWPLDPSMLVESSPGKLHAYWPVDGMETTEFFGAQKAIAGKLGSDTRMSNLERVMRLPGFYHMKNPGTPHLVRIIQRNSSLPYSKHAINAAFPPIVGEQQAPTAPTQGDDPTFNAIEAAGLILGEGAKGGWNIHCPWESEHTRQGAASATMYFPPHTNHFAHGGFDCKHQHCEHRKISDLRARLGVRAPVVELVPPRAEEPPPLGEEPVTVSDPLAWRDKYLVSQEVMNKIANPTWIYQNLAIQSHVIVVVAEPNGGKTTIMLTVAAEMASDGYEVSYINADANPADAKEMHAYAAEAGFALLLPDLADGNLSMADVVKDLNALVESNLDLTKQVIFCDTLKKMTEVINKTVAKELYKLFRSLSARGMTVIVLAHTNKHKDAEGELVYEGTGDLRADVDELIFLKTGKKSADKSMLVSTKPDKVRGAFEPITWRIDADRTVSRVGYVDVGEAEKRRKQYSRDREVIELILEVLADGPLSQTDIVKRSKDAGGPARVRTIKVLKAYCSNECYQHHWNVEHGFAKNAVRYSKIKNTVISEDTTTVGDSGEFVD